MLGFAGIGRGHRRTNIRRTEVSVGLLGEGIRSHIKKSVLQFCVEAGIKVVDRLTKDEQLY